MDFKTHSSLIVIVKMNLDESLTKSDIIHILPFLKDLFGVPATTYDRSDDNSFHKFYYVTPRGYNML